MCVYASVVKKKEKRKKPIQTWRASIITKKNESPRCNKMMVTVKEERSLNGAPCR